MYLKENIACLILALKPSLNIGALNYILYKVQSDPSPFINIL